MDRTARTSVRSGSGGPSGPPRHGPRPALWVPAALIILATPLAQWLGLVLGEATGSRLILPVLAVAPFYPVLVVLLRRGLRAEAILAGLLWALVLGATATALCHLQPEAAREAVWNGPAYRAEMLHWVETGEGAESDPRRFLPQHALHASLFALLCLATGGLLGLLMGAALMHYMAYYVAGVMAASPTPWLAALVGWHPWSLVRIAAFVVLGVVLSEPLLRRLGGRGAAWPALARWCLLALAGLAVDAGVKATLAEGWRSLLLRLVG